MKKKAKEILKRTQSKLKTGPLYVTLALADDEKRNADTNATTPSIIDVEEARKWSEVNTL